jgi:tetratricopeptide (TPR) repeat protein
MSKAISARAEGRLDKAEDLYRLAFHELKDAGEHESAMGVSCLRGLGQVCHERGKRDEAESLYKQALSLCEKGNEWTARDRDSSLIPVLEVYAKLLRDMGREGEAERLEARAKTLRREAAPEQAPGAGGD